MRERGRGVCACLERIRAYIAERGLLLADREAVDTARYIAPYAWKHFSRRDGAARVAGSCTDDQRALSLGHRRAKSERCRDRTLRLTVQGLSPASIAEAQGCKIRTVQRDRASLRAQGLLPALPPVRPVLPAVPSPSGRSEVLGRVSAPTASWVSLSDSEIPCAVDACEGRSRRSRGRIAESVSGAGLSRPVAALITMASAGGPRRRQCLTC